MEYCRYCHTLWVAPIGLRIHMSKMHGFPGMTKRKVLKRKLSVNGGTRLQKTFASCIFCREWFQYPSGIISHLWEKENKKMVR